MNESRLCKSVVVFGKRLLPRGAVCLRAVAVLLLALALLGGNAHAANRTWDGGGADNNWLTSANWDAPLALNDILFFAGSTRLTTTNDAPVNSTTDGLNFNSGAGAFTLWGNALNLGGGITNNSTSLQTINLNLALTATRNIEVVSAGSLTIGGVISGAGFGLTKTGAGTLTLSGVNTFTGVVTLNGGTLRATTSLSALGTGAATLTLAGGTLELAHTASLNFARNTTVSGNTTITADRTAASATSITHTLGTLSIGGQTLTVQRGANVTGAGIGKITFGAVTLTGAATFDVGSSALLTFSTTVNNGGNLLTIQGAGDTTISGIISGTGGLTKAGTGILTLGGANTYGGDTTITAGTIALGANNRIPNGVGKGNVIVNGTLNLATFAETINGLSGSGTVTHSGGTDTLTVGDNNATADFSGIIVNPGSTLNVTKIGTGTQTFSGNNAYSGLTTVSAGALNIQHANALGNTTGNTVVNSGAALQIQGGITTAAEALTLKGTGVSANGALRNISGANTYAGAITLGSAARINSDAGTLTLSGGVVTASGQGLTVGGAGNVTVTTTAISGAGTLTKDGAGTLALNVANTYTGGTTLSQGTLRLGAANALGGSTSAFNFAGGILDGNNQTASIGALSLTASSTLNLTADSTPGTLTFSSATWTAGTLTINGWSGSAGGAGTDDRIFITAAPNAAFLNNVNFIGFSTGATWLGTGEIVPVPEPINVALGVFGVVFVGFRLARRLRARRSVVES